MVKVNNNFHINPSQQVIANNQVPKVSVRVNDSFHKGSDYYVSQKTPVITSPLFTNFNYNFLLSAYANEMKVNEMMSQNPKVKQILDENNIPVSINPINVLKMSDKHLKTTKAFALQIANYMNLSPADKQILEQACVFHDFGKILIPTEILNKPGVLNEEERKIMDLHAELGYELLSTTGMNKRTLELIKNHHNSIFQNNDVLGQILSVADIYSALREERSYKRPMTQMEAFKILDQKALSGEVSAEVVNSLKSSFIVGMAG